jgi:hypothetical protein
MSPGTFSSYGPFAVGPGFLARCGSRLHKPIAAAGTLAANARAVIWETGTTCGKASCYSQPLDGLLLPTLRQFRLTLPATASLVAMSAKHIYVATPGMHGTLYAAPAPSRHGWADQQADLVGTRVVG